MYVRHVEEFVAGTRIGSDDDKVAGVVKYCRGATISKETVRGFKRLLLKAATYLVQRYYISFNREATARGVDIKIALFVDMSGDR